MKIYIDPGYNTINHRSTTDILIDDEYKLTAQIADELSAILRSNGLDVLVSGTAPDIRHGSGRSNTVASRVSEANNWGADYYIILQLSSSNDPFTTGSEVSIYKLNSPARPLADSILARLYLSTGLQDRGVSVRPDLYVVSRTNMPAVLVSLGYSTNENDANHLVEHPEQFVQGVANGILSYIHGIYQSGAETGAVKAAFYQSYPESRTGSCRLNIDVSTGNRKRWPVPGAEVTVFHGSGGKRLLVYRGLTDRNGRAITVELPLFSDPAGKYDIQPQMYCICVRHPEYLPKNQWVTVTDQKNLNQTVTIEQKRIK